MPHRLTRNLLALAVAVMWTVVAPRGWADQPSVEALSNAEALATEAKVYFRTKQFDKAADKFLQAFGISKRPALVYNAARAYEEAGKHEQAVSMFEHYGTLDDVDDKGRRDAKSRVKKLRKAIAHDKAKAAHEAQAAAKANAAKRARATQRARVARAKTASAGKQRKAGTGKGNSRSTATPKRYKTSGTVAVADRVFPLWSSITAGSLMLFSGAAYANAYRLASKLPASDVIDEQTQTQYQQNKGNARTWQLVAISSLAVGAGIGAWAGYKWLRGSRTQTKGAWLMPAIGRGGITLHGRF